MKNNAISILSTFSDNEIISFGEFLESPFHNKNRRAVQLFDLLVNYHPFYDDVNLTKEELFAGIFGKEKFKDSYIRNLFSDLKILLENYLIHSGISKSPGRSKILIEELHERELKDLLDKRLDLFEKEIDRAKLKDQEYYSNKLFVYEMKSFSTVDITLTDDFRKDQISAVIKFFLIDLMESSFQLAIEEQRVQIRHDYDFLKYVLEYVKNNQSEFSNVPLLMIYYYLWMGILEDDSNANFSRAREYFKTHFNTMTQPDKKNIYSVMQIYYANKIQAGDTSYNRILLDLLLEMLDYNVISHNRKDSINLNLYRNILILCFKLNETAKLKKFVSEYLKFVRAESRSTVSAYSSAHINFMEGKYEDSLMMCQKVSFNDLLISTNENLYFKIDMKTLILKCLYELNAIESIISHIETFKQFLNNSRLIKDTSRKKHLYSVNVIRDMVKLKLNFDEFRLLNLKNKIIKEPDIPGSDWIKEKLDELEKENQSKK